MKVLFVTSWFPSKFFPTNGNFVERHAIAFQALGHEVIVVHEEYSNKIIFPRLEKSHNAGLTVFQIFLPRSLQSNTKVRKLMVEKMLRKYTNDFRDIDVVQGHVLFPVGPIAVRLADRLKAPLYFTEHWSGFLPERKLKLSSEQLASIQEVASKCKTIMPVSQMLKKAMQDLQIKANYEVVFNTVDTSVYKSDPNAKADKFTFLHVSNFAKGIKNVDGIMRAFNMLKTQTNEHEAKLVIAGDGDVNELERIRVTLAAKDDIQILGTQSFQEVARLMQMAHCFVLFSEFETFGLVAAEAQCCGLPLILSDAGALPERISPEMGLTVKPGDESGLTNAMEEIIGKYSSYSAVSIQESAHKVYSYSAVVDNYVRIYKRS